MRITCVLGPYLPVPTALGGAVERVWQNLTAQFAKKGHDVTLISRRYADFPVAETLESVRYLRVSSRNAPRSRILYRFFDAIYAARVAAMLPPSDVTITNSVSLPLVLPRNRAGKIYVSVARFPKGQMAIYRRAHRLQAVSRAVADAISRQSPSVVDRVRVLPNALSSIFSDLGDSSTAERRNEILYVGRIAREKGLHLLIGAFLALPNPDSWTLTLLGPVDASAGGDGPEFLSELHKIAATIPGRIRFEDAIFDEKMLAARMQQAAIFVYPSVAERGESFGMAPLEAMACGCAVIVSGLECFRDFIENGVNGLVFDHHDPSGQTLSDLLQLLINQPHQRRQLASEAFRTARMFSADKVADLFISDFSELAGKSN
jgi:glycosyltransferase involved in cell wall biosynthesis